MRSFKISFMLILHINITIQEMLLIHATIIDIIPIRLFLLLLVSPFNWKFRLICTRNKWRKMGGVSWSNERRVVRWPGDHGAFLQQPGDFPRHLRVRRFHFLYVKLRFLFTRFSTGETCLCDDIQFSNSRVWVNYLCLKIEYDVIIFRLSKPYYIPLKLFLNLYRDVQHLLPLKYFDIAFILFCFFLFCLSVFLSAKLWSFGCRIPQLASRCAEFHNGQFRPCFGEDKSAGVVQHHARLCEDAGQVEREHLWGHQAVSDHGTP